MVKKFSINFSWYKLLDIGTSYFSGSDSYYIYMADESQRFF
ncbi:hypothetical protein [Weissella oryzae]|nr:hypothetical protein [Weissella oryzae]